MGQTSNIADVKTDVAAVKTDMGDIAGIKTDVAAVKDQKTDIQTRVNIIETTVG
jgi:hypothetical protein